MNDKTYKVGNYTVTLEYDVEPDNVKIFHYAKSPDGKETLLDVSPYDEGVKIIPRMIEFHELFGYYPERKHVGSGGSPTLKEVNELFAVALEYQFEGAPTKGEE